MQHNKGDNKSLLWICRVLMTANLLTTLNGYFAFFQTQLQLNSPLIPRHTVFTIFYDTGNDVMFASIASAAFLLVGFWLYTFGKLKWAAGSFAAGTVIYFLLVMSGILNPQFNM